MRNRSVPSRQKRIAPYRAPLGPTFDTLATVDIHTLGAAIYGVVSQARTTRGTRVFIPADDQIEVSHGLLLHVCAKAPTIAGRLKDRHPHICPGSRDAARITHRYLQVMAAHYYLNLAKRSSRLDYLEDLRQVDPEVEGVAPSFEPSVEASKARRHIHALLDEAIRLVVRTTRVDAALFQESVQQLVDLAEESVTMEQLIEQASPGATDEEWKAVQDAILRRHSRARDKLKAVAHRFDEERATLLTNVVDDLFVRRG